MERIEIDKGITYEIKCPEANIKIALKIKADNSIEIESPKDAMCFLPDKNNRNKILYIKKLSDERKKK